MISTPSKPKQQAKIAYWERLIAREQDSLHQKFYRSVKNRLRGRKQEKIEPKAFCRLAALYCNIGDYENAKATISKGLKWFPDHLDLKFEYAAVDFRKKNWLHAIKQFEALMRDCGGRVTSEAYEKLVETYRKSRDYENAELAVLRGLKHFPDSAALKYQHAVISFQKKNYIAAIEKLKKLLAEQADEAPPNIHAALVDALREAGRLEEAEEVACRGLEKFPDHKSLISAYESVLIEKFSFEEMSEHLKTKIEKNEIKDIEEFGTRAYASLFKRGQLFNASQVKAEAALALSKLNLHEEDVQHVIAGAKVYRGKCENALAYIQNLKADTALEKDDRIYQLEAYSQILLRGNVPSLAGDLIDIERESIKKNSRVDDADRSEMIRANEEFLTLVKGKSIAIVGPANTQQLQGLEIDGFDLVVRNNLTSADMIVNYGKELGRRTDIVYYNATFGPHLKKEVSDFLRDHPKITPVFRGFTSWFAQKRMDERNGGSSSSSRILSGQVAPFLGQKGSLHGIQKIIWDMLKFSPSKIKLFNVDFFVSGYNDLYISKDKEGLASYQTECNFGYEHDPLQSFVFTKEMFKRKLIECDPLAKEILTWSKEEYLSRLQEMKQAAMARHESV
jgi:Tfp pilus assembly protein PilF